MSTTIRAEQQPQQNAQQQLAERFDKVRSTTMQLAAPLSAEDTSIQSMPDASPTRWHLAHTTWFFETFVLAQAANFRPFHPNYSRLYNSYYNTVGQQYPRTQRGVISRPGLAEIIEYRQAVDQRMTKLLSDEADPALLRVIELGLHHEQQHQELILTDIKHALSLNPLYPAYIQENDSPHESLTQRSAPMDRDGSFSPGRWTKIEAGVYSIGHDGEDFAFDNERPRHRVFLEEFAICNRLVTCGQWLEFISDGGYRTATLWLASGWDEVRQGNWDSPLYWQKLDDQWHEFTLAGLRPVQLDAPVCHVSYFEADAFARWAGMALPTEFQWEAACQQVAPKPPRAARFVEGYLNRNRAMHPVAADPESDAADPTSPQDFWGNVWEWTSSQYLAYPGYQAPDGALGEYNGKFMCNQFVLRGGSCATMQDHMRLTYRNFFPPQTRWQFAGVRLAKHL